MITKEVMDTMRSKGIPFLGFSGQGYGIHGL
jgi:hypothetical protein